MNHVYRKVTNNKDIPKFDGSYFNVWKHRLSLIMKVKRFMIIVNGLEKKLEVSTIVSFQQLSLFGKGSIID